ncbi:MAG: hypothetical protein NVSMB6_26960 [Burkholderiaceae bacterium]
MHRPVQDVPDVGRFAGVSDPFGAEFLLFKNHGGRMRPEIVVGTPGHIGWHELHAGDGPKAFEFYSGLFGWTKADAIDMGEIGIHQAFATGGAACGGMMTKTPDMPTSCWLYYINVDAIDAAIARTGEAGGKLVMGPHEVPGGSWIAQCFDRQGALFAMVAQKR